MYSKRQRIQVEHCRENETDCYNEVMELFHNKAIYNPFEEVRCSWLRDIRWISSQVVIDQVETDNWPFTVEDIMEMRQELQNALMQLNLIKRRLSTAPETSSSEQRYHNNGSSYMKNNNQFDLARNACNPFEILGVGKKSGLNNLFMNRSAIKLANIDAALGFCLTSNFVDTIEFVDLCSAPGGFSEYMIWRSKMNRVRSVHGYGMSLVGKNAEGMGAKWKLRDTMTQEESTTIAYQVCKGFDGTGDIYNWDNVTCLKMLMNQNQQPPVEIGKAHIVLADGGFDAQRDSEDQEQMAQKLIVCEVAAALSLLRVGGTFVIKMFGFQSPVVRCVVEYLFFAFTDVLAIKPISSRPASAERYLVCSGFYGNAVGWDGQRWRDSMLMGKQYFINGNPSISVNQAAVVYLHSYLDEFDKNLISLNMKACFAILTYLDTPKNFVGEREGDDREIPNNSLNSYRLAWQLL